ncbi:MAG: SRPBCC family protein [Pseudomonadota bacterium]
MTIATTAAIVAGTIAVAAAGTLMLPRNVEVQRSAHVALSPEDVLALASSTGGFQSFNPYLTADPDLKITPFGPDAGVGAGFAFDGKDGKGTQTIAEITEARVTYHIDMGAMGQPTQIIEALPAEGGSTVTWTVQSDLGMNPVFRVFGLFMDGMLGKTYEQGLANMNDAAV